MILSTCNSHIDELLQTLDDADTLIVTELSRLGRSTAEIIALVNAMIKRNIRVIIIKQNLDISRHDMNSKIIITLFSLFAELERDMISLRTKEALLAKKHKALNLVNPREHCKKANLIKTSKKSKSCLDMDCPLEKWQKFWVIPVILP